MRKNLKVYKVGDKVLTLSTLSEKYKNRLYICRKIRNMEVVISTSGLNSYGSRVLTSGIDYSQYSKNPIVLWMHNRPWQGTNDEVLPIGKMKDIRVVGDKLIGDIEFDTEDEFAKKVENKYKKGILNMVSAGLDVVELSDDTNDLIPGQTRMTLKKTKLREVSCVDIGANDDSLRLYKDNKEINMSKNEDVGFIIPLLHSKEKEIKTEKNMSEKINSVLNLAKDATEESAIQKIEELKAQAQKGEEMEKLFKEEKEQRVKQLVDQAVKERRIPSDKKEVYEKIGLSSGIEALTVCLSTTKEVKIPDVSQAIRDKEKKASEEIVLSAETWDKMDKDGTLLGLKEKDNETFKELFDCKFKK